MQNIPAQWEKSCTFERNDSQTDLGIMKSKMNSQYLSMDKTAFVENAWGKETYLIFVYTLKNCNITV